MKRLTRPTIEVDESVAKYLGKEICLESINDRMLELILNGPTLMSVKKDVLRQLIRQLYSALQAYEDTGLTPEQAGQINDSLAQIVQIIGDSSLDRLRELAQADKEGRLVVMDGPRLPLIWGDADHDTTLCPNCRRDLMGGFEVAGPGEEMMAQCPHCGQPIDVTKAKEPEA